MATRQESIAEIRSLLGEPLEGAPSLHRAVGAYLRFEGQLIMRLNNTGAPWAIKSFDLDSDPDTDTYELETGTPAAPIADFGKPLAVIKATGQDTVPFIQVPFGDYRNQNYGVIPETASEVTPFGVFSPATEKLSFYREGAINPVNKVKINPVPQTVQTYTITYSVGAVGREDDLTATYAIPELASWVELQTAMALLPYAKWGEDMAVNMEQRKELAAAFAFQLQTVNMTAEQYIRDIVHPRPVEVDVCY
jgi:hypothetical protein